MCSNCQQPPRPISEITLDEILGRSIRYQVTRSLITAVLPPAAVRGTLIPAERSLMLSTPHRCSTMCAHSAPIQNVHKRPHRPFASSIDQLCHKMDSTDRFTPRTITRLRDRSAHSQMCSSCHYPPYRSVPSLQGTIFCTHQAFYRYSSDGTVPVSKTFVCPAAVRETKATRPQNSLPRRRR